MNTLILGDKISGRPAAIRLMQNNVAVRSHSLPQTDDIMNPLTLDDVFRYIISAMLVWRTAQQLLLTRYEELNAL
jgi:hypothetical protein